LELNYSGSCRGTVLGSFDWVFREGAPDDGVPSMPEAQSFYERHFELIWWFVMARIGQDLRERYQVPEELPPKLVVLVGKLDDRDWLFPSIS